MINNFIEKYTIDKKNCRGLIELFENNTDKHNRGILNSRRADSVKKSTDISIPSNYNKSKYFTDYLKELTKALNKYQKKYIYSDKHQCMYGICENINIQKYKPKEGFYIWHHENDGTFESKNRHLVFMTYLNDVKNGGTAFLYQNKKFQAKIGSTLIWPATWTHTHKGVISKTQTKYIITGWYSYYNNDKA